MSERNLKASIVELLHQQHLLSATNILATLENFGKSYNKTSVYRALDSLIEDDKICRLYFQDGQAFYELRSHHHAHLVCNLCGAVQAGECQYSVPEKLDGFAVDHHHVTLVGVCQKCQKLSHT